MTDSIFTPGTDSPHRRKSSRKSWSDQSPVNPMTDIAREETLLLTHFAKKPTISFGKVKIGKSLDRKLYVTNPHEYDQSVVVEKFPSHMNFAINLHEFVVPGESTLCLYLTWTPENEGGCRQIITFLVDDSYRLQTVMYGTAEVPRKKKVAKRGIMSQSVKTPFAVLHTPNLANLKTYNTSMVQERVLETTNVRRALPISKSNQENRQPCTKKSSLATAKSPTPKIQNVNYQNQVQDFGVSKRNSANQETKLKTDLKDLQPISKMNPEQHQTDRDFKSVEEPVIIEEYKSVESTFSEQEHVTKISSVNVWTTSEESCQIESRDEVTEMQVFDCEFRKRQKQSPEQDLTTLNSRRETYSIKKNMSKQRRNWRNRLSSPSVRAAIPKRVIMPTTKSEELVKSTSNAFNFITSSPIGNCAPTNDTFKLDDCVMSTGPVSSQIDCLEFSNSKDRIEERPVMTNGTGKFQVSPKSDDGMSTDSLNSNSKNSSASSVEALLTSDVKKSHEVSAAVMYDFRQATPSLLEKPHPYEVRRSTHVVKEPKFVCGQGKLKQKQLFSTGAASSADPDVSYMKKLDDTNDLPPPKTKQFKSVPTARNSVSSRVRVAQKAMRITNKEQLSQSVHERLQSSGKLEISEKSASNLTRSARSAVRSVKKTEITKSKNKSYTPKKGGVAQSRLVLGKREKTVVPKHPMPFASKNIYYDDRWMQKQEWSFTHWFNFILTPVEDYKLRNCPKVDAGSLVFNCKRDYHLAPSKEVLSFEAYAARRRLNRLRKLACKMFQSADVVKVVRKMEVEIDRQRLVVRKDRPIHADIGLKQNILNWILSYNPLWLRIGLEMVFGEVLLIESNTDILGLSKFIITRLVGNPDLELQYAHPTVPHLYREGYQAALAKHTLKKFLILVYFLDYAKRHRLIEHDPCLLCTDSKLKASRDFLVNISRDFLSGEGDVTRHLSYLGYVVSYVQTPLDEFDYAVTNLATDLRDGVRLTRVVEILTGEWGLTKMLRAPAISRLQKVHNVEKVLKALVDHGMSLDFEKTKICAKDIVDGHREKTLALLWRIVTQFQVDILLDVKELEDEIACLDRSLKRKMAIWKAAGVKSDFELKSRRSSVEPTQFENSTHRLLFGWCRAVCAHYGLKIENFTVSFSDGRVLCFLIHHYFPGLLPISEIRQQTTVTYINEWESQQQQDSDNSFEEAASTMSCSPRTGKPLIYQELLANEAENFKLIAVKVSQIGGVPTMLRHLDMSNTIPDEKVVITYVMYLAIRLLEIRHEARAAIVIQLAWRKYQLRKKNRLLKLKSKSQTPIPNYEMVTEEKTPDQSSPLKNKTPTSIKNAIIAFADHLGDAHLGHSINDYSPIRPIDNDPLPLSSKKGKVLDTILECSSVAGCLSYSNISHQEQLGQFPVLKEDMTLDAGQKSRTLNRNMKFSDGLQSSLQADQSYNAAPKRDSDNMTNAESSEPSHNTVNVEDGSFDLKAGLPKSDTDLRNETFNSDRSDRNSLLPSDLPNINGVKISGNETFESETLLVKSDLPVVECLHIQNETFEKEIHSERAVPNLSLSSCEQGGHNLTFDREVNLSNETALLSSKVELPHGNKTFDSGMSRPDLLNALSTIEESVLHENEEEFENLKSENTESEQNQQQMVESSRRNIQEAESYDVEEQGPFPDAEKCLNDEYSPASHKEKTLQLALEKTPKLSDPSLVCISDESAITARLDDRSPQNEIANESQSPKNDSSLNQEDNRITELESNDENEDLFNDSYVCQVQNDSVSFSRLNKTEEVDKLSSRGSTPITTQSSANDSQIRNHLDISCPVKSLQDSFTRTDGENNYEKAVESDGHLSVLENEGKEEWTEEFILKMSRSRQREMIADNEEPVEKESDDHVRSSIEVSCPANLLQESFTNVGESNCDKAVLSISQLPQSISDENEELSEEFVSKMSNVHQKEMLADNENQSQSKSPSICPMDKPGEDDTSTDNDSTFEIDQDPEVCGHVRIDRDVPCLANSLQESYTSVDRESDQTDVMLSNKQLQQSIMDENEEWTEEFVLKMSSAGRKEMIVDKEDQADNMSEAFSRLDEDVENDGCLNKNSMSEMHYNPEDDYHARNGLDISCPVKSLQNSFTGIDGEDDYDKAILSDSQLHRSVTEDEEWTEEFVLKMSHSRQKEMIVDREGQVENESVSFSQLQETTENDKSVSNGGSTAIMDQNSEHGGGVRNSLDISCPSDSLQDSFNCTDGENNSEKAVLSDSQLRQSVLEDKTEGSSEEFVLKMSSSRQREITDDDEAEVENTSISFSPQNKNVDYISLNNDSTSAMLQSPGNSSNLQNGLDVSYQANSLQESFPGSDGMNNSNKTVLSDSQLQQSDAREDGESTEEFVLKMSSDSDSASERHQSLEDDYHDGNGIDVSCSVTSLQNGVTDTDEKKLSDSQLHRSDLEDENEEFTKESILKMSQKEMTLDNEVEDDSIIFSQQNKNVEDMSLHNNSTSAMLQSSGDCSNLGNGLDVPDPTNMVQNSLTDVDGENNCDKAILSNSQLQQSDVKEDEEWSEEFVLKMSCSRPREMIVDKESLDSSEGQEIDVADKSAEIIQNAFRSYKARQEFLQLRNSAIAIQHWYRRTKEMRKSFEYYRSLKAATIVIQASVRSSQERKRFLRQRKCVVSLQQRRRALVAMRKTRSEYLGKMAAVKAIQRWYRSITKMRSVREDFERTRTATLKVQSLVRMWICRRRFLEKKAALALQMQKKCVIALQQRRRALVTMRKIRSEYLAKVAAVKTIQKWYRSIAKMRLVKENFERTRNAVVKIQSLVRMWICQRKFSEKKKAAITIQIWYRSIQLMKAERMNYVSVREATIRIQAMFRSYSQRKMFLLEKKSASLIQKTFRMFINRKHYMTYKNSAITIQQWYRRTKKTKEARQHYHELKMAALVIQSAVRSHLARKRFLNEKRCLILLQRRRRCLLLMRTARTEYLAKRAATKTIQRWYRAITAMQKAKNDFQNTRMAIIKIQSLVRQRIIRKEFLLQKNSVLILQKWFRAALLMKKEAYRYKSLKNAAIQIQAIFRGQRERKSYLLKRESALKIQSMFRMCQLRKSYLCRRNSAITIQQWYRNTMNTRKTRRSFMILRAATLVIQSNVKAYQERRRFLLKKRCVVSLQRRHRGVLAMRIARSEYLAKKHNAIIIQRWYRSVKLMSNEMTLYRSKKVATIRIQSVFRGHLQRKVYLEKRKQVIAVQSIVRMWIARRSWFAVKNAAVMIQRNYRRHLARRRLREMIARRYEAAVRIQSWFRMKLLLWSQKGLLKIECDCCSSTSLLKTKKFANIWLERTRQKKLNAVCVLQKYWRIWFQRRNQAATKIQTVVRGWLARRRMAKQKSAAILIQKNLRGWHARITFRKRRQATRLLQPVIRGWLVRKQVKKWNHSAALIQSFWRGYKVRCSTKGNVTNVRKRLLDAIKKVTNDKKLSSRFSMGFDYLMKYKQLSELLQALVNLEVSSRLSPVCCAQLADGNAAPIIFTIIRSCNRSVPHMELIKYSIQILLNLAKYAPTIEAVYDSQPDAIDIIFNVMTVFREKGLIFSKSCILLAIIALDMQEKGVIDKLWSRPKFKEQIMSLYKLTERKYKREESRVTTRARMVAVKNSTIFYKFSNVAADKARIGPDWLLGKKILREVEEPLQAMTYLLNCLNLRPETQQTSCRKTRLSK